MQFPSMIRYFYKNGSNICYAQSILFQLGMKEASERSDIQLLVHLQVEIWCF